MLETIITAAITAAIIQLLPYGWRRVKSLRHATPKMPQPTEKETPLVRQRPPSPMLDRLHAQADYIGSPEYILAKAKVKRSQFRVTEKDLEGAKSIDDFLDSGSSKLTEQEVEHLLSGDSDATALSNIWSRPDPGYLDKLKDAEELRRANFGHMLKERAQSLYGRSRQNKAK
jgi:hypothetical protein